MAKPGGGAVSGLPLKLGRIVATAKALEALGSAGVDPRDLLARHQSGDWGEVPPEDARENELSLEQGFRILSSYSLPTGQRLWVLTEADRSVTTLLRPQDY